MKWTNQIENRLLILGTAAVMAIGFWFYQTKFVAPIYKAQNQMMHQLVEQQNKLIEQLAKDPKYSISNDFGKMKPKEGSSITLDLNNNLDASKLVIPPLAKPAEQDSSLIDTPKKKKTLWQKLFKKQN